LRNAGPVERCSSVSQFSTSALDTLASCLDIVHKRSVTHFIVTSTLVSGQAASALYMLRSASAKPKFFDV